MNSIPRRGLLGIALFCSGLSAASYAAEPYTLDGKDLAFSRQQIAAKDPLFVQAQAALLKKADLALNHPLFTLLGFAEPGTYQADDGLAVLFGQRLLGLDDGVDLPVL